MNFMLPGTDFVGTWIGFIFVVGLFVIGLFIYKLVGSHFRFNKSYNIPLPLKWVFKIIGSIVYLALCIIVIGYASN